MAFLDKLNQVAKQVGDKASDALETGKLSAKISAEKFAVADDLKKIGEYYYSQFAAGETVAPEVLGYCNSAKSHYDTIEAAQAEMRAMKEEGELEVVDASDISVE